MSTAITVPIDPRLFTWPDPEPKLLGTSCSACGVVTFPTQASCPRCGRNAMETMPLARRGTLWSWTTQAFRPKKPYAGQDTDQTFKPFALGYVELGGQIRVEGRLLVEPADIRIGMELELVIIPFRRDHDGTEVVTFAFGPVESTEAP